VLIEQGRGLDDRHQLSRRTKSLPAQVRYSAAKHGIVGLTMAAAIELGPFRIRVNSIHPRA
jgi:NAD(P)-dependent dehydrogenase (short-subunit alcohol dehydrogenase family)